MHDHSFQYSFGCCAIGIWLELSEFDHFAPVQSACMRQYAARLVVFNPRSLLRVLCRCMFAGSLYSNLLVEAVMPPTLALVTVLIISLLWHAVAFSCGLRMVCNTKRAFVDQLKGRFERRKLRVKSGKPVLVPNFTKLWGGEKLLHGTYARIDDRWREDKDEVDLPKRAAKARAFETDAKRTIKLAGSDVGQVWVAHSSIPASQPKDYDGLDTRRLRRLLRTANVETSGKEDDETLRHMLNFQSECDDDLVDDSMMPRKLARHQIYQACMYVMVYYYTPCTRALQQFFMCRSLAGSGTEAYEAENMATDPLYAKLYLKHDMQYPCYEGQHSVVMGMAAGLWFLYAVAFPVGLAAVIARNKAQAELLLRNVRGDTLRMPDYWSSTTPVVERFWMPVVAHLQPQYWYFFISEFFRKVYISLLYIRGFRSDDSFSKWRDARSASTRDDQLTPRCCSAPSGRLEACCHLLLALGGAGAAAVETTRVQEGGRHDCRRLRAVGARHGPGRRHLLRGHERSAGRGRSNYTGRILLRCVRNQANLLVCEYNFCSLCPNSTSSTRSNADRLPVVVIA